MSTWCDCVECDAMMPHEHSPERVQPNPPPTDLPAAVRGQIARLVDDWNAQHHVGHVCAADCHGKTLEDRILAWHQGQVEPKAAETTQLRETIDTCTSALHVWVNRACDAEAERDQLRADLEALKRENAPLLEEIGGMALDIGNLRADLDAARGELVKEREARNTIARELANRHDDSISLKEEAEKQRGLADHHLAESAMWEVKYDEATATARRLRAALEGAVRIRPNGDECWCWGDELEDEPHQPQCIAAREALADPK